MSRLTFTAWTPTAPLLRAFNGTVRGAGAAHFRRPLRSRTTALASVVSQQFQLSSFYSTESDSSSSADIQKSLKSAPPAVSCTVSPPSTYAFLKPTPIVLLTGPFGGNWSFRDTWQATLADQGYQSTSIELAAPADTTTPKTGDDYIRHFVSSLKTSIETDHSFFPPILIAHGLSALVAQRYVESNPVSALILVSPFIPKLVQGRFTDLATKLIEPSAQSTIADQDSSTATTTTTSTTSTTADTKAAATTDTTTVKKETVPEAKNVDSQTIVAAEQVPTYSSAELEALKAQIQGFKTHSDVAEFGNFRDRFILPKKAIYNIDKVAQKNQETIKAKEEAAEHRNEEANSANIAEEARLQEPEAHLGKDSIPVFEDDLESTSTSFPEATKPEELPVLTVESESSIRSELEQLPLSMYSSISTSLFEPTFPILLVTSNGDEIVSTADIKNHHPLAGEVDHIELEDLDDGGHLIMVSDNTEWEQGIQGITAWLDSNGM